MTHDQIWSKVHQAMDNLPITDDASIYKTNPGIYYLVDDIQAVRDAFFDDYEAEENLQTTWDQDISCFLDRHGINWK